MEEDRTPDLRIANATLSQLSYHPVGRREFYRKAAARDRRRRWAGVGSTLQVSALTAPLTGSPRRAGCRDSLRARTRRTTVSGPRWPPRRSEDGNHLGLCAQMPVGADAEVCGVAAALRTVYGSVTDAGRRVTRRAFCEWAGLDSNQGPRDYETGLEKSQVS